MGELGDAYAEFIQARLAEIKAKGREWSIDAEGNFIFTLYEPGDQEKLETAINRWRSNIREQIAKEIENMELVKIVGPETLFVREVQTRVMEQAAAIAREQQ